MYGMTQADFDAMLEAQDGKCANVGCGAPATNVDHNHATDEVRGLLCWPCNIMAGHAQDSPLRLLGLAEYLKKHQ